MRRVIVLLAAITAVSAPLEAQSGRHSNRREGFWIGFGGGGGSAAADCASCATSRTAGGVAYLRLGGTLSRQLLLGGEFNGWYHSQNAFTENAGFTSLVLLWYPSAAGAFYVKFGVGGMRYTNDDGVNTLTATAPSGSLGVGYEFRTGRNVSVVPFFNGLATSSVSAAYNGLGFPTGQDIKVNVYQIGLGITFH